MIELNKRKVKKKKGINQIIIMALWHLANRVEHIYKHGNMFINIIINIHIYTEKFWTDNIQHFNSELSL